MENSSQSQQKQTIVFVKQKSMGVSIILTILFGPLGMFYSTIGGTIFMILVNAVIGFFTAGIGLLLTWPICIIWGAVSTSSYNKSLLK
jgi:hypothetical protein